MKTYRSRLTAPLAIIASFSGAVFFTGIILSFVNIPTTSLSIALIAMGGLPGILFFSCFLAEKSRALMMDTDQIIFPRGATVNGKIVFSKTVVKMKEITSAERNLYKGDGIISKDTYFYTMKIKDGTKITVTLFAYGKKAEKEISETILEKTK